MQEGEAMAYTEPAIKSWMLSQLEEARSRRQWATLPQDFEAAAVARVYAGIKSHFGKSEIRERIAASKARTFNELEHALAVRP